MSFMLNAFYFYIVDIDKPERKKNEQAVGNVSGRVIPLYPSVRNHLLTKHRFLTIG